MSGHILPGSPVRPPNARGSDGGAAPRSRSRQSRPWYDPAERMSPDTIRQVWREHGNNEGLRSLEHNPERDRLLLERAQQSRGMDTSDYDAYSYTAPRGSDEDLPREGESVTDWVNRTSGTPKIQKCDDCKGRGRKGPYGNTRQCRTCKGSGYLDMQGQPHVAIHAILRAYASGKRMKQLKEAVRHTAPGGGEHAPYRLKEEGGRWYVVNERGEKKEEDGYATKAEAREHQKALYANVPGAAESAEKDEKRKESRKVGFGETKAPTDVDTLRDEECPVCGESSAAYDGSECQVCGYVAPPEMFRDPDLDIAGQVDLRKDNLEQQTSDPNQDGLPAPGAPQALDQQQDALSEGQPAGVLDPNQITDDGVPQQQPQMDPFGNPLSPQQQMDPNAQGVPSLDPEVQQQLQQNEGPLDADGDGSVDVEIQPTAPGQEQALPSGQPGTADDGVPDLVCPSCGFQADSEPPQSVSTEQTVDPLTDDPQAGDGLAVGDVCPNCGQGLLASSSDMQQQEQQMGAQPAPVNGPASPQKVREATSSRRDGDALTSLHGAQSSSSDTRSRDGMPAVAGLHPTQRVSSLSASQGVREGARPDSAGVRGGSHLGRGMQVQALHRVDSSGTRHASGEPTSSTGGSGARGPMRTGTSVHGGEHSLAYQAGQTHTGVYHLSAGVSASALPAAQGVTPFHLEGSAVEMSRPVLEAVKQQQRQIDALLAHAKKQDRELVVLKSQNVYLARLAGVSTQFEAIRKRADELNPAQPVPDPPSEGPSESTQEAATPEAQDNVFNLGQTPGSVDQLPAETTTTPMEPGVTLPTEPFNELVNVQAPVAGTETQRPLDETKTLVDVRVGDPDNPEPAFPLNPAFQNQQTTGSRAIAALRLARLRIASKIEAGDDISVAAAIESGDMTPEQINHEISTLSQVVKAARVQQSQSRPAGLVPRAASAQAGRNTPSLAPDAPLTSVAFASDVTNEVGDSDLFLGDF